MSAGGAHEGKTAYVKRLVWIEVDGPIPEGALVISTCGERTCIDRGKYTSEPEGTD